MGAKGNEYKIRISKIMQSLNGINEDLLYFENEAEHFEDILSLDELLYCIETLIKRFGKDVSIVAGKAPQQAQRTAEAAQNIANTVVVPAQVTYQYVEPVQPVQPVQQAQEMIASASVNPAPAFESVQPDFEVEKMAQETDKPAKKAGSEFGEDYYDREGDYLEAYPIGFEEIYNELKQIGTFWGDPDEYYYVFNNMEKAMEEINEAESTEEKIFAINNWNPVISRLIAKYKEEIEDEEYISGDVMKRIRLLNRLLRLFEQADSGVTNPWASTILVFCLRLVQVCLCKGLNSEFHEEYLKTLLDEKTVFAAQKEIAEARILVKEYGKATPLKDRKKLLAMDDEKATDRLLDMMQISPEAALAYSPTLCSGLLKDIGYIK